MDVAELGVMMPFIMVIAVVWIVFHYRRANRMDRQVSGEEQQMMERMMALLEKMEGRIVTLEKILDAEDPRWREKVPPTQHL
jgi:phage shock protein B